MRKFQPLIIFFVFFLAIDLQGEGQKQPEIQWANSYEEALSLAKKQGKPLFLYFNGSDWCPACHSFKNQILKSKAFSLSVADSFIFLDVDFPRKEQLPEQVALQNQNLLKKFRVSSFPTVILANSSLDFIASRGYLSVPPEKYASHLMTIINEHKDFEERVAYLESGKSWKKEELEELYNKAKEFERKAIQERILEVGSEQENNLYFLSEKYRLRVKEGLRLTPESRELREEILTKDPVNEEGQHRFVAIVDFQGAAKERLTDTYEAIAPLKHYLGKFGDSDQENRWRIELTIAQYLFTHDDSSSALKYANMSYLSAPSLYKESIRTAIHQISAKPGEGGAL